MTRHRYGNGFMQIGMSVRRGRVFALFLVIAFVWIVAPCPETFGISESPRSGNPVVGTVLRRSTMFSYRAPGFTVETFAGISNAMGARVSSRRVCHREAGGYG